MPALFTRIAGAPSRAARSASSASTEASLADVEHRTATLAGREPASASLDRAGALLARGGADHDRALTSERFGDRGADTPRGTRYERDAPAIPGHASQRGRNVHRCSSAAKMTRDYSARDFGAQPATALRRTRDGDRPAWPHRDVPRRRRHRRHLPAVRRHRVRKSPPNAASGRAPDRGRRRARRAGPDHH